MKIKELIEKGESETIEFKRSFDREAIERDEIWDYPLDIIVKTPKQIKKRLQKGDFFIEDVINFGKVIYERADKRVY